MPYDEANKRYYPDFQADTRLPQWIPMDSNQDQGIDIGPMAGAFKNRFMNQPAAGPSGHPGMEMPATSPHEAPTAKPGGFRSL